MVFFVLHPHPPPGNSSLASYFSSNILASKTPLPLGISNDLPWGGYGFFQELHIVIFKKITTFFLIYKTCFDVTNIIAVAEYLKNR